MNEPAARSYVYELHENGAIVATGRLTLAAAPSPGDTLRIGRRRAIVRELVANTGGERRLVLDQHD